MKKYIFSLIISLFSVGLYSQCSINAGGMQFICETETCFLLDGTLTSAVDQSTIQWTQISGPDVLNILSPNTIDTDVCTNGGGQLSQGTYVFNLTANCIGGGMASENTSVVVTGILAPPTITYSTMPDPVCTSVNLIGTLLGPGEIGEWRLEPFSTTYTLDFTDNLATLSINNPDNYCRSTSVIYTIDNMGCNASDTITIDFINADEDVRFTGLLEDDNTSWCGDTLYICGSAYGCDGNAYFTFTETPNGVQPTSVSVPNHGNRYCEYFDFTNSGSGWYTIEYHVEPLAPCIGGIAVRHFYVCVVDINLSNSQDNFLHCDGIPATILLENTNPAADDGCVLTDWTFWPTSADITIDQSTNIATINDPTLTNIYFDQIIDCGDVCEENTTCVARHRIRHRAGAEVQIDADTVNLLCGGEPNFFPSDYYDATGLISTTEICINRPGDPPGVYVDCVSSTNNFFDLTMDGQYIFQITVTSDLNGVTCSDVGYLVVNVANLAFPSAGDTDDFCLGESVQLQGSNPNNPIVDLQWTQIDNNLPLIFDPSSDIIDPYITANETGIYCLEYTYSRSADCYLADTVCFEVTDCDTCVDHKIEFIDIECKWVNGQQIYNYELIVHDAQDCGDFIATTNGNNPHLYGYSYVNGDLIINGSVSGLNNALVICIYINFENDDCCDLRVCSKKPKCCEKSPSTKVVRLECRQDKNGNNY